MESSKTNEIGDYEQDEFEISENQDKIYRNLFEKYAPEGKIQIEQLGTLLKVQGFDFNEYELYEIMQRWDYDQDNYIDYTEFVRMCETQLIISQRAITRAEQSEEATRYILLGYICCAFTCCLSWIPYSNYKKKVLKDLQEELIQMHLPFRNQGNNPP